MILSVVITTKAMLASPIIDNLSFHYSIFACFGQWITGAKRQPIGATDARWNRLHSSRESSLLDSRERNLYKYY